MRDHIILNADIPMMSPTTVPNLVEGTTQQPGHMLIQEFKMERPPEGANSSECIASHISSGLLNTSFFTQFNPMQNFY